GWASPAGAGMIVPSQVLDLARRIGPDALPAYVYDLGALDAHAAAIRAALPDRPLAFGGPGKTPDELAVALKAGTARFHVESPHELAVLDAGARAAGTQADVLLRVNPPGHPAGGQAQLVMGGKPSPFGMDLSVLRTCAESLSRMDAVRLRGLHAHLASGLG